MQRWLLPGSHDRRHLSEAYFRTNIASHLVLDFVEEVIGGVFLESSLNIHGTDFWSYALSLDAVHQLDEVPGSVSGHIQESVVYGIVS